MIRRTLSLILPLILIASAAAASLMLPKPAGFETAANFVAWGLLAGAAFLGVHFHRLNVLLGVGLMAMIFFALAQPWAIAQLSLPVRDLIWMTAWWLLPVGLLLLAWLPERSLFSIAMLLRLLLIVAIALGVVAAALGGHDAQLAAWLSVELLSIELPLMLTAIPQGGLLMALLAVLGLLLKAALDRHGILPLAWLGMLGFSLTALLYWPDGGSMALLFGAAALVMIVSLMQLSYRLAFYDELTGIPGRRALYEAMGRLGGRYTVAMSDIDFFKKFNDTHGHDVGDQVLKMVALKLQSVRGGGRVFRYGGEEFTILFDGKEAIEAQPFLEEVRRTVEASHFTKRAANRPKTKPKKGQKTASGSNGTKLKVTISLGAASKDERRPNPEAVMKAADEALYKAKEAGRNCVVVA